MNNTYLSMIEKALYGYLPSSDTSEGKLIDAMRYSLEAGGKRVRPMLVMEFNAVCGGNPETALPLLWSSTPFAAEIPRQRCPLPALLR